MTAPAPLRMRNGIVCIPRQLFLDVYWDYRPGQHVTFVAPTQQGKTTLAFEMLDRVITPKLPAVILNIKPRDPTVTRWTKRLKLPTVKTWPPPVTSWFLWGRRPRGWVLHPKHSFNEGDDEKISEQCKKAVNDSYKRGRRILVADECEGLVTDLGMAKILKTLWRSAGGMKTGVWAMGQRAANIPLHAYSQATHLILGKDRDKRARERYAEISGVDKEVIIDGVLSLREYEFLYVCSKGGTVCIVLPE